MSVDTLIKNGDLYYICETCGQANRVQIGDTKCSNCSAWYKLEIRQTVRGTVVKYDD